MVSNKYLKDFEPALISRGEVVELDLTPEEVIQRIRDLISVLPPEDVDVKVKDKTLEFLLSISSQWKKLDFRTFKSCVLAASSGNPTWKKWVVAALRSKSQSTR
jgi:hypothetical protein